MTARTPRREDRIRTLTGYSSYRVSTVRPPFGLYDHGGWQEWVKSRGLCTVMWGPALTRDCFPMTIEQHLLDGAGGLVLLAHPNPHDEHWLLRYQPFLADLCTRLAPLTAMEALTTDALPVEVAGIPRAWL